MGNLPYSNDCFNSSKKKVFINESICHSCHRTILRSPRDGEWEHSEDNSRRCWRESLVGPIEHKEFTPFMQVINQIVELHERKQADYGRVEQGDPFANVRASEDFGIDGWVGTVVRANDKMRRLQKAARQGADSLKNESVEDSLMDLAVYAIIALCLFREKYGEYA